MPTMKVLPLPGNSRADPRFHDEHEFFAPGPYYSASPALVTMPWDMNTNPNGEDYYPEKTKPVLGAPFKMKG